MCFHDDLNYTKGQPLPLLAFPQQKLPSKFDYCAIKHKPPPSPRLNSEFQAHRENAPECLGIVFYTELIETKGIVLMPKRVSRGGGLAY